MTREISNYDNIIDSRDVIARLEELGGENLERLIELLSVGPFEMQRRDLFEHTDGTRDLDEDDRDELREMQAWLREVDEDELRELITLRELVDEASASPDWTYGEALIRRSYFVEYAQQLADDIGAIDANATWPMTHIDWDAAARDLEQDYFEVDFDGVEYLIRA